MVEFILWYREFKRKHPEIGTKEARAIYEDNQLKNLKWIYDLGWTREEVEAIPRERRLGLSTPSCAERFRSNTKTLMSFFKRDEVLELLVRYYAWMCQDPELYRERWLQVQELLGEGWQQVVQNQIREDPKRNIIAAIMFCGDESWEDELDDLWFFSRKHELVSTSYADEDVFVIRNRVLEKYNGDASEVHIPEGVREIGFMAFADKHRLTRVVIPDHVKHIRADAFADCVHLEQVVLPESLRKIEGGTFWNCYRLKEINLPHGLKEIGEKAFCNCRKLRHIRIPPQVSVEGGAFAGCTLDDVDFGERTDFGNIWDADLHIVANRCILCHEKLEETPNGKGVRCTQCGQSFTYSAMYDWTGFIIKDKAVVAYINNAKEMPDGVTRIARRAFDDAAVPALEIPASVTEMEEEAFLWCDFAVMPQLPSNLQRLEEGVFCGSGLTHIYLPKGLEYMGERCLAYCDNLMELIVPDHVTTIGRMAVADCVGLKEVSFGENLTELGEEAFARCRSLETVEMNRNLRIIGPQAFMDCEKLEKITIPVSVKKIGADAFRNCGRLKEVYLPVTLKNLKLDKVFDQHTEVEFYGCCG